MANKVWCDTVDNAAIGKTAGTFDTIGEVEAKEGATHILGFMVLVANSGPTSGENGVPILKVTSKSLGIAGETFPLSGTITDGIGTNDKEAPILYEFIPFKAPDGASLKNAKVTFSLSSNVAVTEGWDIAVGMVMSNFQPDMQYLMELMSGACAMATGGAHAEMDAGVKTATPTSFTTGITVPSSAKSLIGIGGFANPNAPTAKEACVPVIEFQSNSIPDFSPQVWPAVVGWGASLGTPVGTQCNAQHRNGMIFPIRFPLPEKEFTMNVSMWFATALTNEADGVAAIRYV